MSAPAPWIKPAIAFGIPLLAVVIGLPYVTGRGYEIPGSAAITRQWQATRQSVTRAVAGEARGGSAVRLYDCQGPKGRVLSDTPCGRNARVHEIDPAAVNTFHQDPVEVRRAAPVNGGDASPAGLLKGVRADLEAARDVDAGHRAAAEQAAE